MNLSPELLALILQQQQGSIGDSGYGYFPVGPQYSGGDAGDGSMIGPGGGGQITKPVGGGMLDTWDLTGNYLGQDKDKTGMTAQQAALLFAAMVGGGMAFGGGGTAATGGELAAGFGADGTAGFLGSGLTNPVAAEAFGAAASMPGFTTAGLGAGAGLSAAEMAALYGGSPSAGTFGGTSLLSGGTGLGSVASGLGSVASGVGSVASGVADAIKGGGTLAGLVGAGLGAAASKDEEQTTSRDPWKPAQPFLESLLKQGQTLSDQYAANPFSPQQKQAYNNFGGLLNTINQNAGGLLSGFQANASGANQYSRGRGPLTGSNFDMAGFKPGALSFFGG